MVGKKLDWVEKAVGLGVGEILLTSVDKEGMRQGYDVELVRSVTNVVDVPVIASGGMGQLDDAIAVLNKGGADAIAMAHVLHYHHISLEEIRNFLTGSGIEVAVHDSTSHL